MSARRPAWKKRIGTFRASVERVADLPDAFMVRLVGERGAFAHMGSPCTLAFAKKYATAMAEHLDRFEMPE